MIHHHYQGPHVGLRQQGGDALQAVVLAGAIGQGKFVSKLAGFAHRRRVVGGDAGQYTRERLQRPAARHQQGNPRLRPSPQGPARQFRHQPRPHQRRLARTGGAINHQQPGGAGLLMQGPEALPKVHDFDGPAKEAIAIARLKGQQTLVGVGALLGRGGG